MCSHCLFPVVVTSLEQVVINLFTRLMMVPDLLQVVPTRLIQVVRNRSCYELVVINLLTTCCLQTISDLLEQLVASLLASSTLLQDDNNCSRLVINWEQAVRTHPVDKLSDFYACKSNTYRLLIHTHVKTHKLLQVCKQVITNLFPSCRQVVFALLVPSCCSKFGTSC